MEEQTKSTLRRKNDWRFVNRWIKGKLLDVGCGNNPINMDDWPLVTEVVGYDRELGNVDAQFLPEIKDGEFDTVYSSHCLEHIRDTRSALTNWLRVLRPGGFLVVSVPEELLYENARWPSRYNSDHKVSFTLRSMPLIPSSINIAALLWKLPVDLEHVSLLTEGWDPRAVGRDQTMAGAECAIECVARKLLPPNVMPW